MLLVRLERCAHATRASSPVGAFGCHRAQVASALGKTVIELIAAHHYPPATWDVLSDVYAGYPQGDNRVWYGGIAGSRPRLRPLELEYLPGRRLATRRRSRAANDDKAEA